MSNSSNQNLLRSAIADAKTIRASALENARVALQEAFAPKLQSMLSKKIAEETGDCDPDYSDGKELEPAGDNQNPKAAKTGADVDKGLGLEEDYSAVDIDGNPRTAPKLTEDDEDAVDLDAAPEVGADDATSDAGAEIDPNAVELDVDATPGQEVDVVPTGAGQVELEPAVDDANPVAPELTGDEPTDDLELESIIRELEAEAGSDEDGVGAPEIGDEPAEGGEEKAVNVSVIFFPKVFQEKHCNKDQ